MWWRGLYRELSPAMRAALVQQGTTRSQQVHIGDLTTLPAIVEKAQVKAPTLIIVGDVVLLHERLRWFEPTAAN